MIQGLVPSLRLLDFIPVQDNGREYYLLRDPAGISDKILAIAVEVAPILQYFDGNHTAMSIVDEIQSKAGVRVPIERIEQMADMLEDAYFLQSKHFQSHFSKLISEFRASDVRKPSLAGSGYPEDTTKLKKLLDQFLSVQEPDDFEKEELTPGPVKGIIAPHIDYNRGGATYGRVFREWKKKLPANGTTPLIVILGVAHNGTANRIVLTNKTFTTPLGDAFCEQKQYESLVETLGEEIILDEWLHKNEHSIELQVLWVQHLFHDRPVKILPILVGAFQEENTSISHEDGELEELIDSLKRIEQSYDGPVIWIAGIDLAHVGPYFGDPDPVSDDDLSRIAKQDMEALESIKNVDADGWWNSLMQDNNQRKVCGKYAAYLFLRVLEGCKGAIIDYDQAVSETSDQVVSFTGAIIQ